MEVLTWKIQCDFQTNYTLAEENGNNRANDCPVIVAFSVDRITVCRHSGRVERKAFLVFSTTITKHALTKERTNNRNDLTNTPCPRWNIQTFPFSVQSARNFGRKRILFTSKNSLFFSRIYLFFLYKGCLCAYIYIFA